MSCHLRYQQTNRHRTLILCAGAILLLISIGLDLAIGASSMTFSTLLSALGTGPQATDINATIVWSLRLPMTLTALFVGTSLAMAGLQIQNITQNALASPSTLGITSAASFGAAYPLVWD